MALRFSLSLLVLVYFISHATIAHNDPVIQTMEEFSGYPPIAEPAAANLEEAQQNQIRIVQVNNLSLWASTRSIILFFSSCGDIESVEMQSKSEHQIAFVAFKHSLGADCALMLSGTKLLDSTVVITLALSREIPSTASFPYQAIGEKATDGAEFYLIKTMDVFSSIWEKGYVLGASWVTVALDSVAKAAAEVSQHAKEKAAIAEEEQRKSTAEEEQRRKTM
ncbi:hypothetical protein POM88_031192 [Heracleum sosnowskyi]|uniref:RRM domain-containing protein n=1 Tax=Heracleum sosnowskyi TaxID=360622 RepID=A0AAD8HY65_9APIA|nr:hypothetical protein POM88_031192 [Heracleum sosnowskyi]